MDTFSNAVEKIHQAYEDLGHHLGWRFLYTPASTLSKDTKLMFAGINPGASHYEPPLASVEQGNAYRKEPWGKGNSLNSLQIQVCGLYELLSEKLGQPVDNLMDQSLATNLCPFRSPSWAALPRQAESVEFCRELWKDIFDHLSPSVIICMAGVPFKYFGEVLKDRGFERTVTTRVPVAWGRVTSTQSKYRLEDEEVLTVRVPHLSRYRIFGRPESREAVDQLTDTIVESLSDSN